MWLLLRCRYGFETALQASCSPEGRCWAPCGPEAGRLHCLQDGVTRLMLVDEWAVTAKYRLLTALALAFSFMGITGAGAAQKGRQG